MVPLLREHCYSLQWMGRIFRTQDRTSMISKDVVGQDRDAPAEFSGQGLHNVPFLPPARDTSCPLPYVQENNIYASKDLNEKLGSVTLHKYTGFDFLAKGVRHGGHGRALHG